MKLGLKLSTAFLTIGIAASQAIFWQSYTNTKNTLENEEFKKLTVIREIKKGRLKTILIWLKTKFPLLLKALW